MKACPHCGEAIRVNELPHPGLWKNYRICPYCEQKFTVDADTKYRQAACIAIALISLLFTLLWYYIGNEWIIPSIGSYLALGVLIYWGNRKLFFVPYE